MFHRRRNKRLYTPTFARLLNHLDNSTLFSVFSNIFLSSTPNLSGEFYGGELIKIFIGISIFLTSDNCRVGLKLHVHAGSGFSSPRTSIRSVSVIPPLYIPVFMLGYSHRKDK